MSIWKMVITPTANSLLGEQGVVYLAWGRLMYEWGKVKSNQDKISGEVGRYIRQVSTL